MSFEDIDALNGERLHTQGRFRRVVRRHLFRVSERIGFVAAMALVVVASNILVQYPVQLSLGGVALSDILTWGAFTYPIAFLVTDLTNRRFGPKAARIVVASGFLIAVVLSIWLASPRIAIASGTAFLVAQLLKVERFYHSSFTRSQLI